MDRNKLGKLIGFNMDSGGNEVICGIFASQYQLVLKKYWDKINISCRDDNQLMINPFSIIESTISVEDTKIRFSTMTSDPNFTEIEHIINTIETSLEFLRESTNVVVQGNRILVTGKNSRVFSLTVFEICERDGKYNFFIKDWVINISIPNV